MSPKTSSEKEQMISSSPSPGAADLWQSIRTIFELQNQAPPLLPISREEKIPASFAQERLWLADQLQPGNSAYNIPFAFQIQGDLNVPALEQSLYALVQRHESLRTTFASEAGQPVQVIQPVPTQLLSVIDLRSLDESDRQQQTAQLIEQEARQPFDLQQGLLFRANLLHLGAMDFVLMLTVHHIIFDGWSEGILFKELTTLYNFYATGAEPSFTDLSVQYPDYAVWQRQWLQGNFLTALESYWQQQLSGDLHELKLPCDRPRPAIAQRGSAIYRFTIASELTTALKQYSRQSRATLFPTLLAAFQVLLWHYTQQEDLVVCTPTANRNRNDLKGIIGYFVNLLVLRSDVSGDPSFQELLDRVRQVNTAASAHQDLPIQHVANRLETGQGALSRVLFALQNTPRQELQLSDLTIQPLEVDNGIADFDLFLSLTDDAGVITGSLKYNTDLFDNATIHTLIGHFQQILHNVLQNPEQRVSELLRLDDVEQQQLVDKRSHANSSRGIKSYVSQQPEAPRDALELQLTQIWQQVLALPSIGIHDNFFELGGQSLLALRMFNQIEQQFGKNLPLSTLLTAPTIAQLAETIRHEQGSVPWTPLVPFQTQGSKPPFFCVHGLGGNVLSFRDLANRLGSDQPFYGLQPQGLDGDLPPLTRVEDMAALYLKAIRTVQPEGPYVIAGLSMGGMIAYEIAQQLRAQGQPVALLVLLDTYGPIYYKATSKGQTLVRYGRNFLKLKPTEKLRFLKVMVGIVGQKIQGMFHKVLRKPSRTLRGADAAILAAGGKLDRKPDSYVATTPVTLANTRAAREYNPNKPYPDRVALIRVKQRPWWIMFDPTYGWDNLVLKGLEIYDVPGNHYTFYKEPNTEATAEHLKTCLAVKDHSSINL